MQQAKQQYTLLIVSIWSKGFLSHTCHQLTHLIHIIRETKPTMITMVSSSTGTIIVATSTGVDNASGAVPLGWGFALGDETWLLPITRSRRKGWPLIAQLKVICQEIPHDQFVWMCCQTLAVFVQLSLTVHTLHKMEGKSDTQGHNL